MKKMVLTTIFVVVAALVGWAEENLSFYISNHDQSPSHRVIHPIVGKTNFVYDAKGALEKIRGEAIAFLVKDSENVTIRNLRLDWERPCLTEATIVGFEKGITLVKIDTQLYPYIIEGGKFKMVGPGWTNDVFLAKFFDGRTREQTADAGDQLFRCGAEARGKGVVALKRDFSGVGVGVREGDVVAFRPKLRPCPAIVVYNSKNTVLEDVVVHDSYGMALIAQRSDSVTWRGTKRAADKTSGVFPRPGSYASAHADASHFSNVKGQVTVENCWFEGMMDDAINVHSTCLAITNVVAANRIRCRYMHEQAIGFEVFKPGEMLRLMNGRTLENGPEIKVAAVEIHDAREITVTLASDLPPGWGVGDAVENADYQCAATFRNNVICNNRARGTLFTTPKPVVVESNLFNKVTGSPILFAGDDYFWYESGACRDVIVRGNVFSNCCTAASRHGYSKGILSFYPIVRDYLAQKNCYHGNILVEGNEFSGFDVPLLFALSTENIVWRNNRVEYNNDYRAWEEPAYIFRHCKNVVVDGVLQPADTMSVSPMGRTEYAFNEGWKFRKDEAKVWRNVALPHDWAIEGAFDPTAEHDAGCLPYAGVGHYQKVFTLPLDHTGRCVFLDIDGAMAESDVILNGVKLGGNHYGYGAYRVNLTSALALMGKSNTLDIRVRVRPKSARFYTGAGLYRGLRLVVTSPVHVVKDGVHVTTEMKGGVCRVRANVETADTGTGERVKVENRVLGENGMTIQKPILWSPETPHLYTLETKLIVNGVVADCVLTRFGVRTIEFKPQEGFFLNGVRRQMKGVCLHHDLGALGAAFDVGAFRRQVRILKEMGADAIRTSHNPPAREVLDVCDEEGMLVVDEAFDIWNHGKKPNDYHLFFAANHARDMAAFVRRDRNHPCVVLWSIGNEIPHSLDLPRADGVAAVGRELTRICHNLDSTRFTTMGHCRAWASTNGMETATDIFGANYLQEEYAPCLKRVKGGVLATETCSMVSSRGEYFFPVPAAFSRTNFHFMNSGFTNNQVTSYDYSPLRKHNCAPDREFRAQAENPAVYGEFVWTGFDYLGEPSPWDKTARSSYYGIVDLCGFPKDRYYAYQAHWRSDFPVAHILPHWTWPGREGEVTPIVVYANGDEAELFVNGVSQGTQKAEPRVYRFYWPKVIYQPGEVRVEVRKGGKAWASKRVVTAGKPAKLDVVREVGRPEDVFVFYRVRILDAAGNFVPDAALPLTIVAEGGAVVAGVCNGDAADYDSLKGNTIKTFHGLAQVIVRKAKDGSASIRVSADL